jgi:hypothetical protein
MCGKYGLVSYELLIVGASIHAVLRRQSPISLPFEASLHITCIVAAMTAFAVFYVFSGHIQRAGYNNDIQHAAIVNTYNHLRNDDDFNDIAPDIAASHRFQNERDAYDELVRWMLMVWDFLVCAALLLWVVLRIVHYDAMRALRVEAAAEAFAEATDEWAATRRSAWGARRQLLNARREAFDTVVKPLEPYVVVFIIFALPAFVMSTEFCRSHSGVTSSDVGVTMGGNVALGLAAMDFGTCDVWCELALAFRSLGTVVVFLMRRERRVEVLSVCTTCRKLWARVAFCFAACFRCKKTHPYVQINGECDDGDEEIHDVASGSVRWSIDPTSLNRHGDYRHGDSDEVSAAAASHGSNSWLISENAITKSRLLGEGSFGEVWTGRMQPGNHRVAIKTLYAGAVDEDGNPIDLSAGKDFQNECAVLIRTNNPHVLAFIGFGITREGRGFIVTERMAKGSLQKVMYDKTQKLPWPTRISIALQVALGMEYVDPTPCFSIAGCLHYVMSRCVYVLMVGFTD